MDLNPWLSQASRVGAVIMVCLGIVNLMWPTGAVVWVFSPEKAIFLVGALGAWFLLEARTLYLLYQRPTLASIHTEPHQLSRHDEALLSRFEELIDDNALHFLRHHNFGGTFRRDALDPFFEFASLWKGARFQFADPAVEERFGKVREAAQSFAVTATAKTHCAYGNAEMATVKLDPHGRSYNPEADRIEREAAKAVNDGATALVEAIDEFTAFAHGAREDDDGGTGGS